MGVYTGPCIYALSLSQKETIKRSRKTKRANYSSGALTWEVDYVSYTGYAGNRDPPHTYCKCNCLLTHKCNHIHKHESNEILLTYNLILLQHTKCDRMCICSLECNFLLLLNICMYIWKTFLHTHMQCEAT